MLVQNLLPDLRGSLSQRTRHNSLIFTDNEEHFKEARRRELREEGRSEEEMAIKPQVEYAGVFLWTSVFLTLAVAFTTAILVVKYLEPQSSCGNKK